VVLCCISRVSTVCVSVYALSVCALCSLFTICLSEYNARGHSLACGASHASYIFTASPSYFLLSSLSPSIAVVPQKEYCLQRQDYKSITHIFTSFSQACRRTSSGVNVMDVIVYLVILVPFLFVECPWVGVASRLRPQILFAQSPVLTDSLLSLRAMTPRSEVTFLGPLRTLSLETY